MTKTVSVKREVALGKVKRRVDILIEFTLNKEKVSILIENKIDSRESKNQTLDLANWAKLQKQYNICIFLSPQTKQEYRNYLNGTGSNCNSDSFIEMNYQYLVDGVLEPCMLRIESKKYKLFVADYIRCLSQPCLQVSTGQKSVIEENKKRGNVGEKDYNNDIDYTIMAIGREEKKLVKQLWNENQDIIKQMIEAVCGVKKVEATNLLKNFFEYRKVVLKPILYVLTHILDDKDQAYRELAEKICMDKFQIEFKGNKYIKRSKVNSFGRLGRDMIAESLMTSKIPNELIKELKNVKWLSPWLDEVISRAPKNRGHFFTNDDEVIVLGKETYYIARYWTTEDIDVLSEKLKIKDEVKILFL